MSSVFYLFVFLTFFSLIRRCQVAHRLLALSYPLLVKERCSESDLAPHELEILAPHRKELETLNFDFSHYEKFYRFENGERQLQHELVFYHRHLSATAYLSLALQPEPTKLYNLRLAADTSRGQLLSVDSAGLFHLFPSQTVRLLSAYELDVPAQWAYFCKSGADDILTRGRSECAESVEAFLEEQVQSGFMRKCPDGYSFSYRGAFRGAKALLHAMQAQASAGAKNATTSPASKSPVPLEAEVAAFKRLHSMSTGRSLKIAGKSALLLLTALLFFASFGFTLSFRTISILLVVLFLHELGHVAAMRYFKYENVNILFLPFFGAVALGKQRNVPAYQKVIVALAGPIPGLLLGLGLYALFHSRGMEKESLLYEWTWMLIAINFSNLLPVMPLDGGQVIRTLLFSRQPVLEALFTILGGVAFAALGLGFGEPVLAFVGLIILVSAKEQVRRGRLLYSLRKNLSPGDGPEEEQLLRTVYSHIWTNTAGGLNFNRRYQLADYLLSNVKTSLAGVRQTLFLLGVYGFSLLIFPSTMFIIHWVERKVATEAVVPAELQPVSLSTSE